MSKILGLSFYYHDSAAALLINGVPRAMAEEERFSRKKHDSDFPKNAIEFVLKEGSIKLEELDHVVFYEKPFLKLERIFKTFLSTFPYSPLAFIHGMKNLFISKIWIREIISKEIGISPDKILFSEHHLSHAASAFLCSPYEKAAILTIDGVGEWATTTIGIGEGNKIKVLKKVYFPHSLGLLYSAFTAFLGFEVNEGEYKVMGMAPYGKPIYHDKIKKLITFFGDGSFVLNLNYFLFHRSDKKTFSKKFIELFGRPRDPKSKFFTRSTGWPSYFGLKPEDEKFEQLAKEQEYYADIAASIQSVLEEGVINLAKEAYKITGCDKLCLAGGVALNSVANWKIIQGTPFREIFIQPSAGDGGGALGAALAIWHMGLKNDRKFVFEHAYYGKSYSNDEIKETLRNKNIDSFEYFDDEEKLINSVSENLEKGKVIGWFQGRFEWGPRALGNRSIIADPRRAEMKDIVNTKIKFREPYRPFAPSVLAEYAEDFFEIPNAQNHYPARFMLYVVPVKKEKQSVIPAITHVDGTARPQLVFKEISPRYWNLIDRFRQRTGVPMVLNTSFNLKGEPIVNTPAEAINTFRKSEMDVLVIESFLIYKS
ncbi:MAG: carbamoyltransferase N-terminal domain-containing protein [Patescibacteria group bacterium]